MKSTWVQLRRFARDWVLTFILLRSDLPETTVAFCLEVKKELGL